MGCSCCWLLLPAYFPPSDASLSWVVPAEARAADTNSQSLRSIQCKLSLATGGTYEHGTAAARAEWSHASCCEQRQRRSIDVLLFEIASFFFSFPLHFWENAGVAALQDEQHCSLAPTRAYPRPPVSMLVELWSLSIHTTLSRFSSKGVQKAA